MDDLFGGIQRREPTVGLLGFHFQVDTLELGSFGKGKYVQPTYDVEGELTWRLMRPLSHEDHLKPLRTLIDKLMQFAMVFGGFGKSWRRIDHRTFFEEYYDDSYKALIGCHWQWSDTFSQRRHSQVRQVERLGAFIDTVRDAAREWIELNGKSLQAEGWANDWRESVHPSQVQVWARVSEDKDDSAAVAWFHQPYQQEIKGIQPEASIKKSTVTGKIGRIGRIWQRMYPVILLRKDPKNPKKPLVKPTPRYLEILTLFPDESEESKQFIAFLKTQPEQFQQVWGNT